MHVFKRGVSPKEAPARCSCTFDVKVQSVFNGLQAIFSREYNGFDFVQMSVIVESAAYTRGIPKYLAGSRCRQATDEA